jgi:SAM-dependent methyltransferase
MSLQQLLFRRLAHQFGDPTGAGGHVAGWIMSHRSSNVTRSRWAVGLLDVGRADRVLELGCGPGVALAALADRVVEGLVVGVDRSPVMIQQARRRNRAAAAAGRVQLACTPVEDLLPAEPAAAPAEAPFDQPFDAVLAVNNVGFWTEPVERLAALRERMVQGGRIALVSQPRCPGADSSTSAAAADELAGLLAAAGYRRDRVVTLDLLDPPAICVLATRRGAAAAWMEERRRLSDRRLDRSVEDVGR